MHTHTHAHTHTYTHTHTCQWQMFANVCKCLKHGASMTGCGPTPSYMSKHTSHTYTISLRIRRSVHIVSIKFCRFSALPSYLWECNNGSTSIFKPCRVVSCMSYNTWRLSMFPQVIYPMVLCKYSLSQFTYYTSCMCWRLICEWCSRLLVYLELNWACI